MWKFDQQNSFLSHRPKRFVTLGAFIQIIWLAAARPSINYPNSKKNLPECSRQFWQAMWLFGFRLKLILTNDPTTPKIVFLSKHKNRHLACLFYQDWVKVPEALSWNHKLYRISTQINHKCPLAELCWENNIEFPVCMTTIVFGNYNWIKLFH